MRHRKIALPAAILVLLLAAAPLLAQSRNTGALRGVVTDENGGRIPGVLVELQSPDMIGGVKAVTTDGNGSYRFTDLPPGTYSLTYTIQGYQKLQRTEIRLEATRTLDIDVKLTPQAGEETIVVSGQTPLVDITSSATSTNLPEEYLQNLPTSRFQPQTLNLAPGINNDAAFGGGGSSANAYQIDGVNVGDPEGGTPYAFFNYNIMKEVQLVGLGAPAEYGSFTGVVFNSVTKSGSNDFSGMAEIYARPRSWVARNTDNPDLEPPTIDKSWDSTFQVGGPFIKDKLWYFVSAQYLRDDTSTGGPLRTEKDPRLFAKLTWQMNPKNSLEFWGEWDRFDITGRGGDAITPLEATVTEKAPEWDWNISWRSVLTANTSLNVAYTGWFGYYYLNPASGDNKPGHFDGLTGLFSQNATSFFKADRYRHVLNATVSHFSDKFLTGKHDFKYGVEIERSYTRNRFGYPGGLYYYDNYYAGLTHVYSGYGYDTKATSQRASAFVQDSWQITDRFTLNPGLRMDFNRGSVPGKANIFRTEPVAPRLGFTWDVTGKKKTILKGHYGRYFEALFASYYNQLTPGGFKGLTVYEFDPSSGPFDPNTSPIVLQSDPVPRRIDRNLKHPYLDQYILGLDQDLGHEFAVSGTLIYRRNKDFIESVGDPANFTPVAGFNPVTGAPLVLFDQIDLSNPLLITNPRGLERKYTAFLITATKRFNKRWQMLASYVRSHTTGNIDNVDFSSSLDNNNSGQNAGPSDFLDTPNSRVNFHGRLTNDPTNQYKLQGQYIIPKIEVTVSGNYTYVSGQTYTKVAEGLDVQDPNGGTMPFFFNQGTVRYFSEPRGSRRLDPTDNLDFRAEKFFSFNGGARLGVFADVFNVFNRGEDTSVFIRAGTSFGNPREFSAPRSWRLGVRYNW